MMNFRTYLISVEFYRHCQNLCLPRHLREQLNRAASSITLNLAEGYGRSSNADKRRFYHIAMGSLREVQAILDLAPSVNGDIKGLLDKLGAHCYKLIKAYE